MCIYIIKNKSFYDFTDAQIELVTLAHDGMLTDEQLSIINMELDELLGGI